MFYYLNKTVFGLLNPMAFGLLLLLAGVIFGLRRWRRTGLAFSTAALAWFSIWSFGFFFPNLKTDLESIYPPQRAEEMPTADAIVLLGGGMSANTNTLVYAELHQAADRVWHAARLWKAGKAPVIITSGENEALASVPFLLDLGVPKSAIVVEPDARNTEENAKLVIEWLKTQKTDGTAPRRVLLVTSAWHMRRALLMFERAVAKATASSYLQIEIIPAATDYDGLVCKGPFMYLDLFPSSDVVYDRSRVLKEILGYWGYRLFKK